MIFRPATAEDLRPYMPTPMPMCRGIVAQDGDEVKGVAGVYFNPCGAIAFSQLTEDMANKKKDIVRLAKLTMAMLRKYDTVWSLRDETIPTSETLLRHLGFTPTGEIAEGHEVYKWIQQH